MKLFRGLFLALVLSFAFAGIKANAATWSEGFYDISIPALKGIWKSAYQSKKTSEYQYIYTVNAADPNMNGLRDIQARTRELSSNLVSSWIDSPKQQYVTWGIENRGYGNYRLELRTKYNQSNITRYWGVWMW